MRAILRTFVMTILTFALTSLGQAQDQAGSRDIKLNSGASRTLRINQVDTSRFPKVDIFATVLEDGAPVTGLTGTDFRVREDEVEQEPLTVEAQLSPLSVVVTVDTSGSMSKAMQAAREAAQLFVDSLAPQDSVAVVSFNRTVQVLANPGTSREQAKQVIGGLQARGDTALFDAIHASLDVLKGRPGRKAVIVLSDGVDDDGTGAVLSKRSIDESLKLAQELNVPVFTVGLGSELDEVTLQRVATQSGAAFYKAPTADQLKTLYSQLGQQLTGQYQISYTSNLPGDGSIHTIQLGQAALRSSKAYSSPSKVTASSPVAAAPISAPAVAAVGAGTIEVTAGVSPESAPLIQLNQRYAVKNPMEGGGPSRRLFLAYECLSGVHLSLLVDGVRAKNSNDCPHVYWYTNQLEEMSGNWACGAAPAISDDWGVSEERKGRCYLELRDMDTAKMSLFSFSLEDADSGRDAGESEASAIAISVGSTVAGVINHRRDPRDSYKVQLTAGTEYQVRLRPDLKTSLGVYVYDDEGNVVEEKHSQNKGAGVTVDLKPTSNMTAVIGVTHNSGDGYGKYSLVIGPKGVAAPTQPQEVAIPNRVN